MNKTVNKKEKPEEQVWNRFQKDENLTDEQLQSFKRYADLLIEWGEKINLTAIMNLSGIIRQHFTDSLALRNFIDMNKQVTITDVGCGAGFPSIPLKILFPHLNLILIEVTNKRRKFLKELIFQLRLTDVEICALDWRTFLRTTEGDISLFLARASLSDRELCRLFRHTSSYRQASLIYWASENWEVDSSAENYVRSAWPYKMGIKKRRLIRLCLPD